jgi:hypothetical protein
MLETGVMKPLFLNRGETIGTRRIPLMKIFAGGEAFLMKRVLYWWRSFLGEVCTLLGSKSAKILFHQGVLYSLVRYRNFCFITNSSRVAIPHYDIFTFQVVKVAYKTTPVDNIPLFHCVSKRVSPPLTLKGSSFVTIFIDAQEVYFKGIDPPEQTIHPGTLPPLFPSTKNPAFLFNCGTFYTTSPEFTFCFLPYSRQAKIQPFFSIAVPSRRPLLVSPSGVSSTAYT